MRAPLFRHYRRGRSMNGKLLFEHPKSGDWIRVTIETYKGRSYANFRRWYGEVGALRPTRVGVTIPLERLPALHASIGAYLSGIALSGAENGS